MGPRNPPARVLKKKKNSLTRKALDYKMLIPPGQDVLVLNYPPFFTLENSEDQLTNGLS